MFYIYHQNLESIYWAKNLTLWNQTAQFMLGIIGYNYSIIKNLI